MIVDCALYKEGQRVPGRLDLTEVSGSLDDPSSFVWLGLAEPTPAELDAVQRAFNLHELVVEDIVESHQRPKLEVYDEALVVMLKSVRYDEDREEVEFGEIQVFLGDQYAVVVREGRPLPLTGVRRRLEQRPDLLELGPSSVVYAVLDHVVDAYLPALSEISKDLEEVELAVFSDDPEVDNPVERIYKLKREVTRFYGALFPLLSPLTDLTSRNAPFVNPEMRKYFRDVLDHATRAMEQIVSFRDSLTAILDANLTRVTIRQNEDMRKISAWVAIAAVPTTLGAVWGMNFEHMPELMWEWSYPVVLGFIAVVCSFMYWRFRKAGWL